MASGVFHGGNCQITFSLLTLIDGDQIPKYRDSTSWEMETNHQVARVHMHSLISHAQPFFSGSG